MTAAVVLARLHALGVAGVARGDSLALRPASAVPAELLAEVRACKGEVLALLAANDTAPMPPMPPMPSGGGDMVFPTPIATPEPSRPPPPAAAWHTGAEAHG